jgi:hypothetical protein
LRKLKNMKKILILLTGIVIITNLYSCKSKTGDSVCTPTGKFLADGKVAEYWLSASTNGDTSFLQTYTGVTPYVFQQKNTFLNSNILVPNRNIVPYYLKGCGADVFINNEAYNMDAQVAAKNYFVKGNRPVNSTWNYSLNGTKYFCGCNRKNYPVIVKYDTLWVDKIWMRPSPVAGAVCDTILWNDTIGIVAQYGPSGLFELYKKNY